jgi:methyl-accepting chemotaxis protein
MNAEQYKKANIKCFYIMIVAIATAIVFTVIHAITSGFTIQRLIIILSGFIAGIITMNGSFKHPTGKKGATLIIGGSTFFYVMLVILSDTPSSFSFAFPVLLCSVIYLDSNLCHKIIFAMGLAYIIGCGKDIYLKGTLSLSQVSGLAILILSFASCLYVIKYLKAFKSENDYYVGVDAEKTMEAGTAMIDIAGSISSLIDESKDSLYGLTTLMDSQKFVLNDAKTSIEDNNNVINVQTRRIQVVGEKEKTVSGEREDLVSASAGIQRALRDNLSSVNDLSDRYRSVSEKMQVSTQKAKALIIKVDNVKKLVEAFAAMSKQAELLALNASIEASKAGNEGTKLAAVAGELRTFGEKNKIAADKISGIIASFEASVQDIANSTDFAAASISQQREMVDRVSYNIQDMEKNVTEVLSHYSSAQEQIDSMISSTIEISGAVSSLSSANQKAASLLEQSFKNSDEAAVKFDEFKTILGNIFAQANELVELHSKAQNNASF